MANAKYKLIFDNNGKTVTMTESHPKLDSTDNDKQSAMEGIAGLYNYEPVRIDLNSDTTVWTMD